MLQLSAKEIGSAWWRWPLTATFLVLVISSGVCAATVAAARPANAIGSVKVVLSTTSGAPGTPITITGSGFPPGEVVALYIDSPGPYLFQPGPRADAQGGFEEAVIWPAKNYDTTGRVDPTSAGPHTVCGDTGYPGSSQQSAIKACTEFVVRPVSTPSPTPQPARLFQAPMYGALALVGLVLLIGVGSFLWGRRST
jgi:hypothetical protein